ncbi:MAG: hypothetical protein AAGA80_28430 [Cyanobacteria bacterium P01_F01_bin.143]
MVQPIYEGTWEEIGSHTSELAGRRVRLMVLDQLPEQSEKSEYSSLADALSGKVGIIDGTSPDLSTRIRKLFLNQENLIKKQEVY